MASDTEGTRNEDRAARPGPDDTNPHSRDDRSWSEEIEVWGSELVDRVKDLVREGNVRRLIIRNEHRDVMIEVPLTAGVVVGGAVTIVAPVLAALGALAALIARVKIEIVRRADEPEGRAERSGEPTPPV